MGPHSALQKPAWGLDLLFADSAQHAVAGKYVATPTFAKTRLLRDLEVQQTFETWLVGSTGDLFSVLRMYSMATVFALQSLT